MANRQQRQPHEATATDWLGLWTGSLRPEDWDRTRTLCGDSGIVINKDFQVVSCANARRVFCVFYGTSQRTHRGREREGETERLQRLGDCGPWTGAGKLPISTMSLKWLNLNFDKGAAAKKKRRQQQQQQQRERKERTKLLKASCENVDAWIMMW